MTFPGWLRERLVTVFGIDLRTLALFRIALGAVMFIDLANRLGDVGAFYTDRGIMPRDWLMQINGLWRLSLFSANGQAWWPTALILVEMAALLMFALGWRARWAALIAFVLNGSLMNRNPLVLVGGDILVTCLLFWAMLLPVSARFSLDAALARKPPPAHNQYASPATAGLLLQVLSVYFFSSMLKTGADWWPDGTAVDYALQIDAYATPIGQWLRQFWPITHGLSYGVYFLEMLGPIAALSPIYSRRLRFAAMVLLMLMHTGFIFCLAILPFPFFSLVSLTTLAGGWIWDWAGGWRRRRALRIGPERLRIYYDRDCGFCLKTVEILRQLLVLPDSDYAPAQDTPRARALLEANTSWVIIDHDDRAYLKWPAFVLLLKRSPVLWPLGRLLGGRWAVPAGNRAYDFVGRHRAEFGRATARALPYHERAFLPGLPVHLVAAAMALILLAWNLCFIHRLPGSVRRDITPLLFVLRMDQYWNQFAPFPARDDGWYIEPGQLLDGTEVDLRHPDRAGVSYAKPKWVTHEWKNTRWHKYLEQIWYAEFAGNRLYYAQYLCRRWNTEHSGEKLLKTFKIVYMLERSVPRGQTPTVEQQVIWRHECFAPQPPRP